MINWGPGNNDDDDTFLDSHNPMNTKQNGCSEEQANSMTCERGYSHFHGLSPLLFPLRRGKTFSEMVIGSFFLNY